MRLSIGKSRKDTRWKVIELTWSELCHRLSETLRTAETASEYKSMGTKEKSERKDVGGFVGGVVNGGRRLSANVTSRTLVTLDADFAKPDTWETQELLFDYAMCCYSTHSHTPGMPRLRFIIPLDREVTTEEYEPIARRLAADIGIDLFDITTYEVGRLMYWPSTPRDGEFFFGEIKGEFVSADAVLQRYHDWHDTTEWPIGSREQAIRIKQAKAQGDPTEKPGLIGQFCRTYDVPAAIETFLSDVYAPCDISHRYTYTSGSTAAGVVLYDDGKFAYSHHGTDPAGGILCNAFDLVRLHKFSDLDYEKPADTPINKLPSYKAMCEFVKEDDGVKKNIVAENIANAQEAFAEDIGEMNLDWASGLTTNDHGEIKETTENIVIILENDPNLAGKISNNIFKGMPCIIQDVPWRRCRDHLNGEQWEDEDSAALTHYLETTYGIYSPGKLAAALSVVMGRAAFHPVRDYLNRLRWDGKERAETLFIDCLGAEDNPYVRTVTRKWLTAAVARAMNPGCKFDNLVVLVGAQGIGKSYLGSRLGKGWFSDTFSTVQGKEAYEQLNGGWIIEIGELSAMKRAEVESVKMFISKCEDNYRGAYRRFAKVNKRQCIFYGTTNDDSFLSDRTGNRRFWAIGVEKSRATIDVFSLTEEDIDQIWAEAVSWYRNGESLYLSEEIARFAAEEQDKYMVEDPRAGLIEAYLDKLLPANWDELDKYKRRDYIQGVGFIAEEEGVLQRMQVGVAEMAYELFGEENIKPYQAKEYHALIGSIDGWSKKTKRLRTSCSPYGRQSVHERVTDIT